MVFIHGKKTERSIKEDQKIEEKLKKETEVSRYTFQPNTAIKNMLKTEITLGMLFANDEVLIPRSVQNKARDNQTSLSTHLQQQPKHHMNVSSSDLSVTFLEQINVQFCSITGIAVIDAYKLAVANYSDSKIQIIDIDEKTNVSEKQMLSNPWNLALLPGNQLAVTLPHEKLIQILSFSLGLFKVKQLTVNDSCYGIAFHEDTLIVGTDQGEVKMINLSGEVLKTLYFSGSKNVYHITACSNLRGIYASDETSVFCFDMSGKVLAQYTHGSMKKPRGLAVLEDGSIVVCDHHNSSIHIISENMKSSRQILQGTDSSWIPYAVVFDPEGKKLYIGSSQPCKYIKVYSLK